MLLVSKIVIKNFTITEAKCHEKAASRNCLIKPRQQSHNILMESLNSRHTIERFRANIVANELQEHEQRIVVLVVSSQCLDVIPSVARLASIDSNILEVVIVAQVPFTNEFIN